MTSDLSFWLKRLWHRPGNPIELTEYEWFDLTPAAKLSLIDSPIRVSGIRVSPEPQQMIRIAHAPQLFQDVSDRIMFEATDPSKIKAAREKKLAKSLVRARRLFPNDTQAEQMEMALLWSRPEEITEIEYGAWIAEFSEHPPVVMLVTSLEKGRIRPSDLEGSFGQLLPLIEDKPAPVAVHFVHNHPSSHHGFDSNYLSEPDTNLTKVLAPQLRRMYGPSVAMGISAISRIGGELVAFQYWAP